MRIGQSEDIHQLVKNRKLILGGVTIPSDLGCKAHSDGDALVHAIGEAIIGALGLGDLGHFFPDNDPQYENISSLILLKEIVRIMKEKHYKVNNVDSLIIIERPKMAPYISQMKNNLSEILEIEPEQVNVKATCSETLGFVGKSQVVRCQAVVLLQEAEHNE